jgi:hypothetical protein
LIFGTVNVSGCGVEHSYWLGLALDGGGVIAREGGGEINSFGGGLSRKNFLTEFGAVGSDDLFTDEDFGDTGLPGSRGSEISDTLGGFRSEEIFGFTEDELGDGIMDVLRKSEFLEFGGLVNAVCKVIFFDDVVGTSDTERGDFGFLEDGVVVDLSDGIRSEEFDVFILFTAKFDCIFHNSADYILGDDSGWVS